MFLGWYDPDRTKPARAKLAEAIERYVEKFGRPPRFCLTSGQDAAELLEPTRKHPGELSVQVHSRNYIARFTYYIGEDPAYESRGQNETGQLSGVRGAGEHLPGVQAPDSLVSDGGEPALHAGGCRADTGGELRAERRGSTRVRG